VEAACPAEVWPAAAAVAWLSGAAVGTGVPLLDDVQLLNSKTPASISAFHGFFISNLSSTLIGEAFVL
jgi:hypothetical protein